ncbi:MAG: hypothetical protein HGB17_10745, partial [Syntrophobacteraceae bacterium]|nr:hypothetical protein [Syntrophobacteraceae bacterium]
SPLLANLYLHPVDVAMAKAGYRMVRYADDFVLLCRSEAEAQAGLELVDSLPFTVRFIFDLPILSGTR